MIAPPDHDQSEGPNTAWPDMELSSGNHPQRDHSHRADRLRRFRGLGWELFALAATPLVAFFTLRLRPMAFFDVIDAGFYTAYGLNGPDLMRRFGTDNYFWVRLGIIGPIRAASWIAGPVGGFFLLRYLLALLAIVTAYFVARRVGERWLGVGLVIAIMSSPVVVTAWGSDYPDSTAISYVFAAVFLSAMATLCARPSKWYFAAGVLCGLAINSQVVAGVMVAACLIGAAVGRSSVARTAAMLARLHNGHPLSIRLVNWRGAAAPVSLAVMLMAAGTAASTALLSLWAWAWLGHWDLVAPTVREMTVLRTPSQQALWHSSNPAWALTVPYVVVPPAVSLGWAAMVAAGPRPRPWELTIGVAATMATALYLILQFFGGIWLLEFQDYSSMLWATTIPQFVLVLRRLAQGRLQFGAKLHLAGWSVPVALTLIAMVWSLLHPAAPLHGAAALILSLGALVVLFVAPYFLRSPLWRVLGAAAAALAVMTVTTAAVSHPPLPGTSRMIPHGDYSQVLGVPTALEVADYAVAAALPSIVGPARALGEHAATWPMQTGFYPSNQISAMYLWRDMAPAGPPATAALACEMRRQLVVLNPRPLILLGTQVPHFAATVRWLSDQGTEPAVRAHVTVRSGSLTVQIWVVTLSRLPSLCPP